MQPLRHMCSIHFLRERVCGGGTTRRARGCGVEGARGSWESALIPHRPRRSPSSMAPRVGAARPSSRMAAGWLATDRAAAQGLDQGRAAAGPNARAYFGLCSFSTAVLIAARPRCVSVPRSRRRSKRTKAAASGASLVESGAPHREAGRKVPVRPVTSDHASDHSKQRSKKTTHHK